MPWRSDRWRRSCSPGCPWTWPSALLRAPLRQSPFRFLRADVLDPGHDRPAVPERVVDGREAVAGHEAVRLLPHRRAPLDRLREDGVHVGDVDAQGAADRVAGTIGDDESVLLVRVAELQPAVPEVEFGVQDRVAWTVHPAHERRAEDLLVEADRLARRR